MSHDDDSPKSKRRKKDIDTLYGSLAKLEPTDQLELWQKVISNHPFDLQQLRSLRTAIDDRIRLDFISHVPYEVALHIMSFLSPKDIGQASQACRSWRVVCEDAHLWLEKCREEGILDDAQIINVLFRRAFKDEWLKKHRFVLDFISSISASSDAKSKWKDAYIKHVNICHNWIERRFEIEHPFILNNPSSVTTNPSVAMLENDKEKDEPHPEDINLRLKQIRCHEDSVITCLQYNPRTEVVVSGSDDQTLRVWCAETGNLLATLEGHNGGVWSSQLSSDDIIVSGATDRTVKVWRARTGELLHTLYGHTSTVRCLSLDGDQVVSGSRDATLRLWDIVKGVCVHVFHGHAGAVRCVEFKKGIIVSGAYDHLVMVWDAVTGQCIHALESHLSRIYSLQFDGKIIASGSLDSTICIWDVETGKLRHRLQGHQSLTSKMQLKGNLLVSANADSYCKIWDVNTGECLQTLGGENKHTSAITSVYFNNRHVVTSSDDGTVKLWDLATGKFIRNLIVLPTASNGGVIWRIRASYTKLICAAGSRTQTEDTHLLVLDFNE